MNLQTELPLYLDYCQYRKELDPKTIKAYRIDLTQFLLFMQGRECNKRNIEEYITTLHKDFKQKTVKRKIASVKAFFAYMEEEEIIEGNPFYKIKSKFKEAITLPRIIPRDMIEKLLNYMYKRLELEKSEAKRFVLRDICVIELFFATGMRVYELSNLRTENINLHTGVINIWGKGAKERYIHVVSMEVLDLLNEYYRMNRQEVDTGNYFFVNRKGNRYTEQSIRIMLDRYTREAGLGQHITPHMFRHSVATYLLEEEVDVSYIQKLLGHSSIQTTQIYLHVALKRQAEILKEKHPRNKMHIMTPASSVYQSYESFI